MADMKELRHCNVNVVTRYYTYIDPELLDAQIGPRLDQGEASGKAVDDLRHCNVATTITSYGAH